MKQKFVKILSIGLLACTVWSCSFLDVSDELAGGISDISQVFSNVDRTQKWYSQVFNNRPDYSAVWVTSSPMGNPWTAYADEIYTRLANNAGKYTEWNSANGNSQRWNTLYESIRQANIFLERAHAIVDEGGPDAARLTEDEIKLYKANVRFMRAAYHYYLMELYGPVPIVDHSMELGDDLDLPRNSLDEVIQFIDRELKECMEEMAQEPYHNTENLRAVPTKGAALALRAKLWVYAASPLFNGGWPEAVALTNKDGKRLFPDRDESKLQTAVDRLRDFLDYAEQGNRYTLLNTGNPADDLYKLFQEYNTEIIWATSTNSWGKLGDQAFDTFATPRSQPQGQGGLHVLQELVDDFYMKDGKPIKATSFLDKSELYPGNETEMGTYNGVTVSKMYIDREPRFYNTVTFSGMKWHMSNQEIQFYRGGKDDNSVADGAPLTGYMLYKRMNRTVYGGNISGAVTSKYRPVIIFRLAEFYLLYAEMLNEVDPGNDDVLKYVNLVRRRAGVEDLDVLNPAIKGNQTLQREAIRRESRIELATEGQRYFDVRRWMIADKAPGEGGQGGDFTGMTVDQPQPAYYTRTKMQTRVFKNKNYLYPIPLDEMKRSDLLVQNPGW